MIDITELPLIVNVERFEAPGPLRSIERRCILTSGEVQLCGNKLALVQNDKVIVTTYKQKRSAAKAFSAFAEIGRIA